MDRVFADEQFAFPAWLTGELRAKVGELCQRPDGDLCAELADWLISSGHVALPSQRRALQQELATVRGQRDRAWHQLTVLDRQHRTESTSPGSGPTTSVELTS